MEHYFQADIIAFIDFPEDYFEFIYKAAGQHYDSTVQGMVRVGGFMYGMKGRRDFMKKAHPDEPLRAEDLTFRQIDLMCKAIEYPMTIVGLKITAEFHRILDGINETQKSVNHQLHPEP